ncbi:hypothetical protein [Salisediminibacterium halotolerans]|nr:MULTISPECIES: hypothetical protein [Salisediminibacterium]GEL07153.1 hypothetical protein SHA02_05690 [Salisediminibacterium halotolerans]
MDRTSIFNILLIIIIAINAIRHGTLMITDGFSIYSLVILALSAAAIVIIVSLLRSDKQK